MEEAIEKEMLLKIYLVFENYLKAKGYHTLAEQVKSDKELYKLLVEALK
jgi:hypothetical protein